jgi:3-oxoacyl-[acyl-carrier-protein] synthase II
VARAAAEPIAVVGAGVKAPGGTSVEELWASVCRAGTTAEEFTDDRFPPDVRVLVCRVAGFNPSAYLTALERRRFDRTHQLAIGAAQDALDACGADVPLPDRCAVVCGVGLGSAAAHEDQHRRLTSAGLKGISPLAIPILMPSAAAALLSLRFGFRGPCLAVSTACASGATAIAEGVELLRRGAADLVLAGGCDSLITYSALAGFIRLDVMSRHVEAPDLASRPFDEQRDGFVMGEGAGFVVLQRVTDAASAGRQVLGLILGHASTADAYNLVAPSENGEGALACMRAALEDAGVTAADIAHVNAHGTSTVQGDLSEGLALAALFANTAPPVTAVKGTTGHLIGGSGAVEAIVTLRSLSERKVPPVAGLRQIDRRLNLDIVRSTPRAVGPGLALSNSFGFGGMNTALVLSAASHLR